MRIHSAVLALGLAVLPVSRASAISDSERITALEQQIAVLQREISNFETRVQQSQKSAPASAPTVITATGGGAEALSWPLADSALGLDVTGVTTDGTTFVVNRAWLGSELTLLRLPGRAPTLAPTPTGLAVRGVKPKTLAAKLGLQNADTIVSLDDKPVRTTADLSAALHGAKGSQTKVKLLRKKQTLELTYQLAD